MNANDVLATLRRRGFGLFSGVPCSYLTPLINAVIDSPETRYVNAANEGEAVAICSGAELGGVRSVAMFQNSGIGNAISPLTSLNAIFRIPLLVICTWRGEPGVPDEPQHALTGRIMPTLIQSMGFSHAIFPSDASEVDRVLDESTTVMEATGLPFFLFLKKGTIDSCERRTSPPTPGKQLDSIALASTVQLDADECLSVIASHGVRENAVVLATTGFCGRALYRCGDHDNQLYMVGSMGCVSTLALGLALAKPEQSVIAIDGDGSLLMRMSAVAAVGNAAPPNLTHIVMDNGVHESTGSQATLSHTVDIPAVAVACGYSSVEVVDSCESLYHHLQKQSKSLRMIYVRTSPRTDRVLPRPTIAPDKVAARMRRWIRREV